MMMGYGIGSFFYNQIFRAIVNPHNIQPDADHFFPPEVADNFPKSTRYLALVYLGLGTLGAILLFEKKPLGEKE